MLAANLKAGIHKPSFYDPEVNRSYTGMAAHYEVGILPARPRKPRDTTKVEAGVRFAQSYILGRLRHLTFFSLAECNAAIREALNRMNERPNAAPRHQPAPAVRDHRATGAWVAAGRRIYLCRVAPSPLCRPDARALPALGALGGSEHRGADSRPARQPAAPEQGFRTCVGVMRLLRDIDPKRAEQVAGRAIEIGALNYKSIASIRSRPQQLHAAVSELRPASGVRHLARQLAASCSSPTAEALQTILDLDLDDLSAIEPPRGFGRD